MTGPQLATVRGLQRRLASGQNLVSSSVEGKRQHKVLLSETDPDYDDVPVLTSHDSVLEISDRPRSSCPSSPDLDAFFGQVLWFTGLVEPHDRKLEAVEHVLSPWFCQQPLLSDEKNRLSVQKFLGVRDQVAVWALPDDFSFVLVG